MASAGRRVSSSGAPALFREAIGRVSLTLVVSEFSAQATLPFSARQAPRLSPWPVRVPLVPEMEAKLLAAAMGDACELVANEIPA